ncbi:MAG: pyroglutamyl-peptidase I, partial [Acholeplasmataceae bacterium]|nr:pyroglutamyl-peptidase I [Acholeplasmataceae bacterium]
GFSPFDQEVINPSYESLKFLPNQIGQFSIIICELPTIFNDSAKQLISLIKDIEPDYLLMFGQAGGRTSISIERVAINIDDASIPDNRGNQPKDQPIISDGPSAYFSTLPIKKIKEHLVNHGIPTSISNSAGTFVCNHLMYQVLHFLEINNIKTKSGFIHVPYIHEQTKEKIGMYSMSLEDITKAVTIIIKSLEEDLL